MGKKIDWNSTYKPFGTQSIGAKPKYSSGRDYLQKGLELEKQHEEIKANFQKALPALEALLKCRLEDRSPITLVRPLQYKASELVTNYEQIWDYRTESYIQGDAINSHFQDVVKSLNAGTQLILKALDPNLQEFIFEDQNGDEVVLPYEARNGLMTQTNIYEDVIEFMNKRGE